MKIPVIKNPVAKSSNGARRKKPMAKKHRRASPAQIAARKLFAKRFGGKKRKAAPSRPKAKRRKRRALAGSRHRPVVIRKAGKLYRPKRSTLAPHARFANPGFLGNLAVIGGNPMARRKKSHKRRSRRSSRSMAFRNPLGSSLSAITSSPRQMISKDFLTEASAVAVGFVLPNIVITNLPANLRDARWKGYASKVAVVAVLAGASGMVSKRVSKAILLGGGVSLLLDLYTDFVAPLMSGGSAPQGGTAAFFGEDRDPGMGAFFGNEGDPGSGLGDGRAIGEAFA